MSTGSASLVTIETAGRVGTITLNRSQVHNALNREMVAALSAACAQLDHDPLIHVVIIRGEGKSFCSGLDRREPLAPDLQQLLLAAAMPLQSLSSFACIVARGLPSAAATGSG